MDPSFGYKRNGACLSMGTQVLDSVDGTAVVGDRGFPRAEPSGSIFSFVNYSSIFVFDKNAWALNSGRGSRALDTSAMALA